MQNAKRDESLSDQLAKLLKTAQSQEPLENHALPPEDDTSLDLRTGSLPSLGVVHSLTGDQGYGFVTPDGYKKRVFFHVKGNIDRERPNLPAPGARVVFIAGTDPRRGSDFEAVRWRALDDSWVSRASKIEHQKDWNAVRLRFLESCSDRQITKLLRGAWYHEQWKNDAPTDLYDPLLQDLCKKRFQHLPDDMLRGETLPPLIRNSPYQFLAPLKSEQPGLAHLAYFMPGQLALMGAPSTDWMDDADDVCRACLLEWMLHRLPTPEDRQPWKKWLTGREPHESYLADSLLASGFQPDPFICEWLARQAANGMLSQSAIDGWASRGIGAGLALFEHLRARGKEAVRAGLLSKDAMENLAPASIARLPSILLADAVAIDLESDGENTWEVGVAHAGETRLLYDRGSETELHSAMTALHTMARDAPLVIGHNLLAWDWPIIQQFAPEAPPPLVWDTLLVSFLLDPLTPTHALGGTHHADGDAQAGRALFEKQLRQFRPGLARAILAQEFRDTTQLVDALPGAMISARRYARPFPGNILASSKAEETLLWPASRLGELDWIPRLVITSADETCNLPTPLREIDPDLLEEILRDEALDGAAANVILAVVRLATRQEVSVRRNMIPTWLTDREPRIASALDRATRLPMRMEGWRAAPMPDRQEWWEQADLARFRLAVGDRRQIVLRTEIVPFDGSGLERRPAQTDRLIQLSSGNRTSSWVVMDRTATMLERSGDLRRFGILNIPADAKRLSQPTSQQAVDKPILATRRFQALHPGALDQLSYWTEVLRTFCELVPGRAAHAPILLVGSTDSPQLVSMLETALAEIGRGERRPEHRSKREHLLRAAARNYAIVDHVSNWRAWGELARSTGIKLLPVVEALPLEEWLAHSRWPVPVQLASEQSTDGDQATSGSNPYQAFGSSVTLSESRSLIGEYLAEWLNDNVPPDAGAPVTIIDSRLATHGRELSGYFKLLPVSGALDDKQREKFRVALSRLELERKPAPSDLASMERFLVEHWNSGLDPSSKDARRKVERFKDGQRSAMEAICGRKHHVIIPLPTGEGKSVLFQVPALLRGLNNRRLTLVISPLKALMRDQVEGLRDLGFSESVDFLSGDLSRSEIEEVLQGVLDHRIVLLYVAPERLRGAEFRDVLERRMEMDGGLEHVVFDEAHCVNQWGFEFRPEYFFAMDQLLRWCRDFDQDAKSPFLLLSATLTRMDRTALEQMVCSEEGKRGLSMAVRPEVYANPIRSHIAVDRSRVNRRVNFREFQQSIEERLPVIRGAISAAQDNTAKTDQRSAVVIFVSSRQQAEDLVELLSKQASIHADFYHAGLDGEAREAVYNAYRHGELDVLVATTAFGMGMDIPDIHWAVHLSPPGYLEEYLQQVGRIGRGSAEMQRAQLNKLNAFLPFADEDFAHIRGMRHENALTPQYLEDLADKVSQSAFSEDKHLVAVVPSHGYDSYEFETEKRAAQTRTRMALYWLEQGNRLQYITAINDAVEIEIDRARLAEIAQERNATGKLASLLAELKKDDGPARETLTLAPPRNDPPASSDRILETLARKVGLAFALRPTDKQEGLGELRNQGRHHPRSENESLFGPDFRLDTGHAKLEDNTGGAVVSLSQIVFLVPEVGSTNDALTLLAQLQQQGALRFSRQLEYRRSDLFDPDINDRLIDAASHAVEELMAKTRRQPEYRFLPQEVLDTPEIEHLIEEAITRYRDSLDPEEEDRHFKRKLKSRRQMIERALLNGFRSLTRSSGIRLRQVIDDEQTVRWHATLPLSLRQQVERRRKMIVAAGKSLLGVLPGEFGLTSPSEPKLMAASALVEAVQEAAGNAKLRESDLKRTAGLLAALKLLRVNVELVDFSHVVQLTGEDETGLEALNRLAEVNALSEVRTNAMEIFANLRPAAQDAFIEGYFSQTDSEGMKDFLESQLGEMDDPETKGGGEASPLKRVSVTVGGMRDRLRATKAVEFFAKFEKSEEPAQWEAARHPYNEHLLVNAGPGSGKTFVLVGRIVHLIREQHVRPSRILVLAFNRAVVFEIRRRIRELFTSLGYAAHAQRVQVSTLHGFAMRHLAQEAGAVNRDDLLGEFARRMANSEAFRRSVAGDVEAILVDEFQDFGEYEYAILRALHAGSGGRAGVMAIGDDDQDIQRWNRRDKAFSETWFQRFREDFGGAGLSELVLGVNFRSCANVVTASQNMISRFFARNTCSTRLKTQKLVPKRDSVQGELAKRLDWQRKSFDDAIAEVRKQWTFIKEEASDTVAILCRNNAEVAAVYEALHRMEPDLAIQGKTNLRVSSLRHVALWLDFLRMEQANEDRSLTPALVPQLVDGFMQGKAVPDFGPEVVASPGLRQLWDLCLQERNYPRISDLVRFIEELRTDDLTRLGVDVSRNTQVVVSTIHKVKGLEYDRVVIMPSQDSFGTYGESGRSKPSAEVGADAAEEARLFYVAMTRAKKRLWYFWGDRERAWFKSPTQSFTGTRSDRLMLSGALTDVGLGWAMDETSFNMDPDACQAYIEREVRVGDSIRLGGLGQGAFKGLFHIGASGTKRQIGFIAKIHDMGGVNHDLRVSSVVRFYPDDPEDQLMATGTKSRRWGYTVLIAGRLR